MIFLRGALSSRGLGESQTTMAGGNSTPSSSQFFNKEMAESYDERNSRLSPIGDNMHFLIRLVLADLPDNARILCIGVGTGAEILALAEAYPGWTFVGVDPSAEMLEVCQGRLENAGILDRCDLVHGYVEDAPDGPGFDAVLGILVAHFVHRKERAGFYDNIHRRLKPGGLLVSTEICFDLNSAEFPAMLKNWARIQMQSGASRESLNTLEEMLRNTLSVLSPDDTTALLKASGFDLPVEFFQAFMIRGFSAAK